MGKKCLSSVEILVSTMHQTDRSLVERMNIFTDAVVVNQCDRTGYEEFFCNGHRVRWFDSQERGVGKSRNMALMAATADICLFADDDMVYFDDAMDAVRNAFSEAPDASLVALNVEGVRKQTPEGKMLRKHVWNASYGTYRLAVVRQTVVEERIFFSLLFGGGAQYSCGEDSLFISDCLRHGLRLYSSSGCLGTNMKGPSTWFEGYTEKFFRDKGILYASETRTWAWVYSLYFAYFRSKVFSQEVRPAQAMRWMMDGVRQYKRSVRARRNGSYE